jgi:hypothetical protein
MFQRSCLALLLALPVFAADAAPRSVIETKYLESSVLQDNRIG